MLRALRIAVVIAAIGFLPRAASGTKLAYEGFAYGPGVLAVAANNGGMGFVNAWIGDAGVQVQPGLGLQDPLGLPSMGAKIGGGFVVSRNLSAALTQSEFWASFQFEAMPGNDQVWLGFDTAPSSAPAIHFGRRLNAYFIQNGNNAPATVVLLPEAVDLLIVRVVRGGASTTVDLWVNKVPPAGPDLTHVFGGVAAPTWVSTEVQPGFFSDEIRIGTTPSDVAASNVGVEPPPGTGISSLLAPPTPNPFVVSAELRFAVPEAAPVSLRVYDMAGRLVRTFLNSTPMEPGEHFVHWDGRGDNGQRAAPGVYLYRLELGGRTQSRRAVLLN